MALHCHSTREPLAADVSHIIAALSRAIEGTRLLGVDHPATQRACEEASSLASDVLAPQTRIVLTVTPTDFRFRNEPVPPGQGSALLHERLHALNAALLELAPGITPATVSSFAHALATAKASADTSDPISAVNAASGDLLRVVAIDFSRLTASTAMNGAVDTSGSLLSRLAQSTHHTGMHPSERDRAAIIEVSFPPGMEQSFSHDFAEFARWVESLPVNEQPAVIAGLRPLLGTLSPRFREQLLSPGNSEGAAWRVLSHLTDALPIEDVQKCLQSLNSRPSQLSVEAVAVFAKLASTIPDDSPAASAAHAATEAAREALNAEHTQLAERIESILRVHGRDDFSPDDYRQRIVSLSASTTSTATQSLDTTDFEAPRIHAQYARVTTSLAELRPDNALAWSRLTDLAPDLANTGESEALLDAAELLMAPVADSANTKPPAHALIARLCEPRVLAAILGNPRTTPRTCARTLALSPLCPLPGLCGLLAAEPSKAARAAVLRVIESLSDAALSVRAEVLTDTAPALALLSLTSALPPSAACAICEAFLRHRDDKLRAESLRVLESLRPLARESIDRALRDPSDVVASQVVQILRARDPAETPIQAAGVLADFIQPTPSNSVELSPRFDQIVLALLALGDPGIARASATLTKLTESLDVRSATLADRLASHLRPCSRHPDASRAIKRYSRSLTRLIAFFAPAGAAPGNTQRKHAA